MQRVLRASALAAVAYAGKGSSKGEPVSAGAQEPLLTASGTYDFITNSVLVTKDLLFFSAEAGISAILQQVPPQYSDIVVEKYELASTKFANVQDEVESMRLKNGVPPLSELPSLVYKKWAPVLGMIEGSKPFGLLMQFLDAFEKHYPQHAGLCGKAFLDVALIFAFLGYFVFGYMLSLFCYFCCCGFCKRRASKSVELKKKQAAADKKKK